MKICYIGDANSIHLRRWIKWFSNSNHEIHLITDSTVKIDGAIIHPINHEKKGSPIEFIRKMIQTKRLLREIKPDILHAHYVLGYGTFGAFTGFHPFIISPWGSDIAIDSNNFIKRFFIKYALKRADIISVVDRSIKKRLIELKCNSNQLMPLRISSVDTDKFNPSKRSESLRKSLGNGSDFIVLNVRPLLPAYNVEILVCAVPYIIEKMPSVKFILVSFNPDEAYKTRIIEKIRELGIKDKIMLVNHIPHSKMPEYLASIDICVDTLVSFKHTESGEKCPGIGTTSLEAMACGTPVLIANKNLKDKDGCPFVPYHPMDPEDLARTIVELLRNEAHRNSVKERAMEYTRQMADEKKVMTKWNEIYCKLKDYEGR